MLENITVLDDRNALPTPTSGYPSVGQAQLTSHTPGGLAPSLTQLDEGGYIQSGFSPATITSELLTADLATSRWFDLLAADAAQGDDSFPFVPTRQGSPIPQVVSRVQPYTDISVTANDAGTPHLTHQPWQLDSDITLEDNEARLFRTFADHVASWLDLFDADRNFSTRATRLAMRNKGLMKAILALTSRHATAGPNSENIDDNVPVQYYYEALHYIQEAMQYTSYTMSEELLATTITISSYEMLEDSESNWKRHLKGVFWVQRSQDVDGGSGGLKQAVWWAWLQQDLWAAFREKRACFSFWKPVKDVTALNQDELARRAIYLLSQSVNYCARSTLPSMTTAEKNHAADRLLSELERWRLCLGPAYRPLPTSAAGDSAFKPIWIHPPRYAVAVQAWHFARILITLHRPAASGFQAYIQTQRILTEAIEAICGIATALDDEGSQMLATRLMFGAGLCVQDERKRTTILETIRSREARTGWSMSTLVVDLSAEWAASSAVHSLFT